MRASVTPHRVANSIRMQRSQYSGSFLLVEGKKDKSIYKRFIDYTICRIQAPFLSDNKNNVIEVITILSQDGFSGALAIIDADFLVLESDIPENTNILLTDTHDLETMLMQSAGFDKLLNEFISEKKMSEFVERQGNDIRSALAEIGKELGLLRWISYKKDYQLNFNGLKFKKIICVNTFTPCSRDKIIKTVKDNTISKAPADLKPEKHRINEKIIKNEMKELEKLNGDVWHICCGHDLISILSIGLRKALGNYNARDVAPELIERELRLAYESVYFKNTELFKMIQLWEKINIPFKLLSQN